MWEGEDGLKLEEKMLKNNNKTTPKKKNWA